MNADDAYAVRVGAMDMRERCAEMAEQKAAAHRSTANGHTHYGAQQNAIADAFERLAKEIRMMPLSPSQDDDAEPCDCADRAPRDRVWICPKCDAEWVPEEDEPNAPSQDEQRG
ncbi:MAG: hypothetical protein NW206_19760 [Hyphomonadaceae bacterium]|nr:hypothetical protein [Hyphomonadaceae bacterium]